MPVAEIFIAFISRHNEFWIFKKVLHLQMLFRSIVKCAGNIDGEWLRVKYLEEGTCGFCQSSVPELFGVKGQQKHQWRYPVQPPTFETYSTVYRSRLLQLHHPAFIIEERWKNCGILTFKQSIFLLWP
jgi:hypothetical protein